MRGFERALDLNSDKLLENMNAKNWLNACSGKPAPKAMQRQRWKHNGCGNPEHNN
jgi:hypothetical protein